MDHLTTGARASVRPFVLDELTPCEPTSPELDSPRSRDAADTVRIVLGRTRLRCSDALRLTSGSVIELDCGADEPLEIFVGDELSALGELVWVDNELKLRITQRVKAA
ncbi:FliM/FliN family flagellar motor switch protein [Stieleria varia]|uniref:Flagellar motor switch protein FliN n=1 Tax=Stieleria varia TaxID=2528005 RepID=A0A5C6B1L4_9BACT|nr:FliM/FliN family flagellar motor switch protein [Stieleria varia]TWU05717.1 Flagellar motor switch protein FliN [Stieleria varia]